MPRTSAGLLLYRAGPGGLEVLVAHPGGPAWARRDAGAWTIPKGLVDDGEASLESVARREFREETGHAAPEGPLLDLGEIRLRSGKVVRGFAVAGDLDPAAAQSNVVEIAWPPRSGRVLRVPEIDRVAWLAPDAARVALHPAQVPFVDRLEAALASRSR